VALEVYSFENREGDATGFTTMNFNEAQEYARQHNLRLIVNEYEWADSFMIEDHTRRPPAPLGTKRRRKNGP
jgi:hypothetical protein